MNTGGFGPCGGVDVPFALKRSVLCITIFNSTYNERTCEFNFSFLK